MYTVHVRGRRVAALCVAILILSVGPRAWASIGAGSLFVAGATNTPTHWNIPVGVPTTAELRGVATSEVGDPLPPTITVFVKSSFMGNAVVSASRIGSTSDYTFTWTPPDTACNTTIVAYGSQGRNSNNDLLDDGLQNGSQSAACGFRFVNALGDEIPCDAVGVEATPWSGVKRLYRD
jgi:hypothetical protein